MYVIVLNVILVIQLIRLNNVVYNQLLIEIGHFYLEKEKFVFTYDNEYIKFTEKF